MRGRLGGGPVVEAHRVEGVHEVGRGEDFGGHLSDDGGGALAGQGDGLLPRGGDQGAGDVGGVADVAASEQGGNPVDAGVSDRGRGLPAGEDHRRVLAIEVDRAF
ncbi:hypothetical protein NCC78_15670 [Micromonospora phytophila]|uniref:hypothetical protein n=1 Tax=Micromonospora phytophila TaxID=709888 RepID=UPI00202FAF7E|nr:hypothetical protein [Micromonospora phytophila]MCM0676117.1 hypothetical protein [Micromonospora phytophila]